MRDKLDLDRFLPALDAWYLGWCQTLATRNQLAQLNLRFTARLRLRFPLPLHHLRFFLLHWLRLLGQLAAHLPNLRPTLDRLRRWFNLFLLFLLFRFFLLFLGRYLVGLWCFGRCCRLLHLLTLFLLLLLLLHLFGFFLTLGFAGHVLFVLALGIRVRFPLPEPFGCLALQVVGTILEEDKLAMRSWWRFHLRWFLVHTVLHQVRIVVSDAEHVTFRNLALHDASDAVAQHILADDVRRLARILTLVLGLRIVYGELKHTARFTHGEELFAGRIDQIDTVAQPLDRGHRVATHVHLQHQIVRLDVVVLFNVAHKARCDVLLLRHWEDDHLAGRFHLAGRIARGTFVRAGVVQIGRDDVHRTDAQLRVVLHVLAPHEGNVVLEPLDRWLRTNARAHQLQVRTFRHRLILQVC
uniref:Uncharacterized protein n=1 Tax=Anopheles christyi TaxID=43041 RepID=A0A182KIE9_9DIPT